jgi:hypothetical protein
MPTYLHESTIFALEFTAMSHSHLTQWIEDADAREFCQAASWQFVPATESHSLHLGATILRMPARIHDVAAHALSTALRALHS